MPIAGQTATQPDKLSFRERLGSLASIPLRPSLSETRGNSPRSRRNFVTPEGRGNDAYGPRDQKTAAPGQAPRGARTARSAGLYLILQPSGARIVGASLPSCWQADQADSRTLSDDRPRHGP